MQSGKTRRAYSGGRKQAKFYSLLVEDSLSADSLDELHRETRRDIKETRAAFRGSRGFVVGFWMMTIVKLTISALYLVKTFFWRYANRCGVSTY